jgi:hypothetical protein
VRAKCLRAAIPKHGFQAQRDPSGCAFIRSAQRPVSGTVPARNASHASLKHACHGPSRREPAHRSRRKPTMQAVASQPILTSPRRAATAR